MHCPSAQQTVRHYCVVAAQAQAEQADDTFRDVDDLLADIAAADPDSISMDTSTLTALDDPEPQPALLVEVLQSSTNPTVAHLGIRLASLLTDVGCATEVASLAVAR